MEIYEDKSNSYFSNTRFDLIKLLPNNNQIKVLEIGAGSGNTLVEIKRQKKASEVVGIELMSLNDSNQTNDLIDKFIIGNLEDVELDIREDYFDVIIAGDILEHLVDPWMVIHKMTKFLKRDGFWIVSLPNFKDYNTLWKVVILGDFSYSDSGILDKTHLRFFCKKNMKEMFETSELSVVEITKDLDLTKSKGWKHMLNFITFGLFEQFLVINYLIVAKKK